jgi:Ca2+-binding EF-hand superfamily protein
MVYFQKTAYTSKFWRQKMRTLHGIFDINNDGVISFDDFKLLAQNFDDLGHLSKEEMTEFLEVLRVSEIYFRAYPSGSRQTLFSF